MWKFLEPGARGVIALRLAFVSAAGAKLTPTVGHSAAWLIRKRARIGAIGITIGGISGDSDDLVLTFNEAAAFPQCASDFDPASGHIAILDAEVRALRELGEVWQQASNPLLVTCGGRTLDLLFLRYRCLARGIPFPALHLSMRNRLPYFDRYDPSWHLDLADFLAGQGASQPLTFDELAGLCQVMVRTRAASLHEEVRTGAECLFSLLARTLHVMGRCSPSQIPSWPPSAESRDEVHSHSLVQVPEA